MVAGLPSSILAVALGGFGQGFTVEAWVDCAVSSEGGVWCWGYNSDGNLGDGTNKISFTPIAVSQLSSGVKSLSVSHGADGSTACAVKSDGSVWCWGYNGYGTGVLGAGWSRGVPSQIQGFTGQPVSVSVGDGSACVLTTGGGVECWGSNGQGQLGIGSKADSALPEPVSGISSGATAVSVGSGYACAIVNGGVQCWGANGFTASTLPQAVPGLASGATALSVGGPSLASCAVVNGGVRCWGDNAYGELGDGTTTSSPTPVTVAHLPGPIDTVSVGFNFACALATSGNVWCWDGPKGYPAVPHRIAAPAPISDAGADADAGSGCDPEPPADTPGLCLTGTRDGVVRGMPVAPRVTSAGGSFTNLSAYFPATAGGNVYEVSGQIDSDGGPFLDYEGPAFPATLQLKLTTGVPASCSLSEDNPHASDYCPGPFTTTTSNAQLGELDCMLTPSTLDCEVLVTHWDANGGNFPVATSASVGWLHLPTAPVGGADP
jgi:hypothetical protein